MSEQKIVPREPTPTMLGQMVRDYNGGPSDDPVVIADVIQMWQIGYDAAPSAATPAPEPGAYSDDMRAGALARRNAAESQRFIMGGMPDEDALPAPAVSAPDARLSAPAGEDAELARQLRRDIRLDPARRDDVIVMAAATRIEQLSALAQQRGELLREIVDENMLANAKQARSVGYGNVKIALPLPWIERVVVALAAQDKDAK